MFITYLLISVIVYVLLFGMTYLYSRHYTKQVNMRLTRKVQMMLVHPAKFFLLLLTGLFILTILVNLFPILQIKDTVVNQNNSANYTLLSNDYYEQSINNLIKDYDISYNDLGMYVITFGNDKNVYGNVNEALDSPFSLYSKIVLYDQDDNLLWDTDDLSPNQYELIFDNHLLDARAVDFLNNGNIVVFGLSIDLDTNIVYQTIVILDISGNLVELIDLDISDYGFGIWGGHHNYDVVRTDQGFTVEYDTTFRGSVMVHFNDQYEYEWYVMTDQPLDSGVYQGMPKEVYLETLVYHNHAYYVLNDNTIIKYNENGTLLWKKTYDVSIHGFDVFDDEIVILSSRDEKHVVRENLLKLRDSMRNVLYIDVTRLDASTGEIKDTYSFQYDQFVRDYEIIPIFAHYTIKDDLGNYYVLAHSIPSSHNQSYDQVYALMKFDEHFDYIGFSTLNIDGIYSSELADLLFKTSHNIKNKQLYINGVLTDHTAIIDLSELSFSEKDMHISIGFYNILLTTRVHMVNVMLYMLVEFLVLIFPIYQYFTRNDDDTYIDEDLLREKYGNQ